MQEKFYIIGESDEYDKFVRDHNRPVNQRHVEDLAESMKELGFLAEYPISVRPLDDGTFAIIDGQHRHEAARCTKETIKYVISQKIDRTQVPVLAGLSMNWKLKDWLHVFVEEGLEEYLRLDAFVKKYDDMPLSVAVPLCYSGTADSKKKSNDAFKSGKFVCASMDKAEELMSLAAQFSGTMSKHWKQDKFIRALAHIMRDPRFDIERFRVRIKTAGSFVEPRLKTNDYLPLLSNLYNYRIASSNKVEFSPYN